MWASTHHLEARDDLRAIRLLRGLDEEDVGRAKQKLQGLAELLERREDAWRVHARSIDSCRLLLNERTTTFQDMTV